MFPLSYITIVLLILAILTVIRYVMSWRQPFLKDIPRPNGAPFIGNVHQISVDKPHFTFTDWSRQLGEIYCARLFGRNLVVLNGSASIREALIERGQELAGRPRRFRIGCITNDFQNIGFCNPSRAWWNLRQIVHRELKMTGEGLQKLEDITLGIIGETKRELIEQTSFIAQDGDTIRTIGGDSARAIDIRPALYGATMSIMCAFLVGEKYDKSGEEFLLFRQMERLGIKLLSSAGEGAFLDAFPWLRYFGNSTYKRLSKFMSMRDVLYDQLREKSLQEINKGSTGNAGVMQALLRAVKDPEIQRGMKSPYDKSSDDGVDQSFDERFTEEHIKGTFVDLILAGTASTSNLIYAFLNIMLHYPNVYEKIKTEIREKLNERTIADRCGPITLPDRGSMPYMQAAILELLRYVSIAPFSVPHLALTDTKVGGFDIPRGTEVLCNLWALHHDEANWEEPWDFSPERFLNEDGTEVVSADHPRRKHMLPFSAGPRRCTGEVFAMSRLFLLLTSMLKDFDLYPPTGSELVSCDPRTYALGIAFYPLDFNIVLVPTKFFSY